LKGATLLVDTEATEAAVKKLAGPRILHVATHGFFLASAPGVIARSRGLTLDLPSAPPPPPNGKIAEADAATAAPAYENPLLRSGLAFAGANPRKSGDEDGILTALEATGLDLDGTEIVVLSACETGLGEVQAGDGVYGLRRAFVLAGARTEITSLWRVADAETKDLMVHYYEKLQSGGGRSASLRDVQRAMRALPETSHPYYWASFVVSGDPAPLGAAPAEAAAPAEVSIAVPPLAPAAPAVPKVEPGARGCACRTSDLSEERGGWIAVAAVALGLAAALRRRDRGS
jgi:MYXO-CTERM domain-containing protein